jgi:class 3 adenylate cyclase/tetratricopeptide (TPR) repeat protein
MTRCAHCEFDNPPGMRFCGGCGRPLQSGSPAEAERRQLTVMFCDLAGSAALADSLDPEELRELIRSYQHAAGEAIRHFDGHIAQYLGDGILAYFGYPIAHEDDARRAVHAGLQILTALQAVNAGSFALGVRIGIHTGPVVVGEVGSGRTAEHLALGPTPNVAARLQGIAPTDAVVISGQTRDLLKDAFVCEALGARTLKGFAQPVVAFRVLGPAETTSDRRPAGELVGRDAESAALAAVFEEVKSGRGQTAIVLAEAGVGKSRFVRGFQERLSAEPCAWHEAACSSYEQGSALRPVAALVRRVLDADSEATVEESIRAASARNAIEAAEAVPLLSALLGVPVSGSYASSAWSPQKQRERTLEIAAELLVGSSREQPSVLFVEDLHWADSSTSTFLQLLAERVGSSRVLLLATSRPENAPALNDAAASRILLKPLPRADVAQIVTRVAHGKTLPSGVVDRIVERTDGVPLFVEELTKSILESGALVERDDRFDAVGDAAALAIPVSLQASLTARLDRLPSGKETAQRASVIGREFSFAMLKCVSDRTDAELAADLRRLVDAELVFQQGILPEAEFVFKHALIRDAAYEMLLKSTRRDCHSRVARALTQQFRETAESRPELVAHHFTEAGQWESAADYWLRAGQQGTRQSANFEAVAHFQKGLSVLEALESSSLRDNLELALQTSLGSTLIFTHGYTSPAVIAAFERAQSLEHRAGDPTKNLWIAVGIANFRNVRGEVVEARGLGDEMLAAAATSNDQVFVARANSIAAWSRFFRGEFAEADRCLRRVLAASPSPDPEFQNYVGVDLLATAEAFSGITAWHLGDYPRSEELSSSALRRARAEQHAYSRAVALTYVAWTAQYRRDYQAARQFAMEQAAVCERHGFPSYAWFAPLLIGWADSIDPTQPAANRALDPLAIINALNGVGVQLALSHFCGISAEMLMRWGRWNDARAAIAKGMRLLETSSDHFGAAEVYRLNAALILHEPHRSGEQQSGESSAGRTTEAVRFLELALDTARRQSSQSLALRAALELGQIWRDQGREGNARDLVGRACEPLAAAADAADVASARAFLGI